jgi:hypothetical protein
MPDLSRSHERFNETSKVEIHRFMPWCPTIGYESTIPLRIHHYVGSWQSYSFRDDRRKGGRKNRQIWEREAASKGENLLALLLGVLRAQLM